MVDTDSANGIVGGNFDIYGANRTIPRAMTAFTAIAWYNSMEVILLVFFIFKRYSGLYFWSLLVNAISIVPYATGAWMKQNDVNDNPRIYNALMTVGWVFMVPGQSMILYSRLHLISPNSKLLRCIFWMIIVSAVLLCPPTATLNLRQYTKHPEAYTRGYVLMEKIQMTLFTVQEVSISCVYLWETRKVMRVIFDGKARKWMWQLVAMNVFLLLLDVALLMMEFLNLYMIQTTFKSLLYSLKLKIEFAVLSQIVRVIQARSRAGTSAFAITQDIEQQDTNSKTVSSNVSDMEIIQDNVPPEWRLSIGTSTIVSPAKVDLKKRELGSTASSFVSVDEMYPGRLGSPYILRGK